MNDFFTHHFDQALTLGWHAIDPKLRELLKLNVTQFSGFKTYAVQKAMREKLTDAEGNIRSFADFRVDALAVNDQYNVRYLHTEYEQAVAAAQMASKWADFAPGSLLRYNTAGDDHVRHDHAIYDGIVRPKDDPFWNKHFPPCDWGCRCDATEVGDDTPVTPAAELHGLPEVPEEFRLNVGQTGEVFGPEHPYFDVPANVAAKIKKQTTVLRREAPLLPDDLTPFVPSDGRLSAAQDKAQQLARTTLQELLPGLPSSPHLHPAAVSFESMGALGELRFPFPPEVTMAINNSLKRAGSNALSMLHESGHWLDLAHLDTPLEVAGNFRGPDLGPVFDAITKTDRWRGYQRFCSDYLAGDDRISSTEYEKVADYLMMPYETWARAFAQYAATKSGNKLLLDEVYLYAKGEDAEHWSAQDFRPVTAAIDQLFSSKGWLPKP